MEPEGSSHSHVPTTCPYTEPERSGPCPHIPLPEDPSWYYPPIYAWIFQVVSFPQVSPPKPCIHLSPIRATCPAHEAALVRDVMVLREISNCLSISVRCIWTSGGKQITKNNVQRDASKKRTWGICHNDINPLQTKRRPLYLKPQSVPHCKHFSSRL